MQNLLKEVTFKSLNDFKRQDIVLPGEYSKTFQKYAKECNLDLDDQEVILESLNQDKDQIDLLTKETSNNLISLSQSTKDAQNAIEKKDVSALKLVNADIIKMQEQIKTLQIQLTTDTLTKAKNRKWFFDYHLNDNKFKSYGYLVFIDLNNFKYINDNYGHIVGDLVLKYLSSFLQKEMENKKAEVVRYAGDEFMIIFDESNESLEKTTILLDYVQNTLLNRKLQSKKIKSLQFSFSYGISKYIKGDTFPSIIEDADE
ncbi:MAG: GGDEF domain-containing protein, partial [Campylobacteraceae bacterium]|nr:GGDEF domain-containing protein [Campylobacteraceae bacterium]